MKYLIDIQNFFVHALQRQKLSLLLVVVISLWFGSAVQAATQDEIIEEQQRQIRDREQAIQEKLNPKSPELRLLKPVDDDVIIFPDETPCFDIKSVSLEDAEYFTAKINLQPLIQLAVDQCLGSQGINLLMRKIQNVLVQHGYITTRVLAPSQNIATGHLKLLVIPGVIRQIKLSDKSAKNEEEINLIAAIVKDSGDILDLRDIEQGLENLQRLPSVTANFEVVPGGKAGESDIVVDWQQKRKVRFGLSLDDSGSESTGRNQGGLTIFGDNILGISDQLYISAGTDLHNTNKFGSDRSSIHFSFPVGYWSFALSRSDSEYAQTVASISSDAVFTGDSERVALDTTYLFHRNATQKTSATLGVQVRKSRNFINDVEIEIQRRKTSELRLDLKHRQHIGKSTLDVIFSHQKGIRSFGAEPAPEEIANAGTALADINKLDVIFNMPFTLGAHSFRYNGHARLQQTSSLLTPQDRFSIGNRWTVRGYQGDLTLSADEGWFVRNDVAWRIPKSGHELYLGLDYGQVNGTGTEFLLGKRLVGAVLGYRGSAWNMLSFDLFTGTPISKPNGFNAKDTIFGFQLNFNY